MHDASVVLLVVRNPVDAFEAYLRRVAELEDLGGAGADYLRNPHLSDLADLEANVTTPETGRASPIAAMLGTAQRPEHTMYDFGHWLEHQWVQYAGEGSALASDVKQSYVIRYEDLQRDPLATIVSFFETTVSTPASGFALGWGRSCCMHECDQRGRERRIHHAYKRGADGKARHARGQGVGRQLGIGQRWMQRLLRKPAQKRGSAPSRQYTPEHPRDFYELELEPMGRHFGLGYMMDSDYMRALQPYEGLLQRYGCGARLPARLTLPELNGGQNPAVPPGGASGSGRASALLGCRAQPGTSPAVAPAAAPTYYWPRARGILDEM